MALREIYLKKPVGSVPKAIQLTADTVKDVITALVDNVDMEGLSVNFNVRPPRSSRANTGWREIEFETLEGEDFIIREKQYLVILGEDKWKILSAQDFNDAYGFTDELNLQGVDESAEVGNA